ncbi:MAG TPA: ribonuclease III [Gaiellaceae bacterium]
MRTRRRSRPSARPSTTSRRTSNEATNDGRQQAALRRLIDGLDPEQLSQAFAHPSSTPDRASSYERLEFLGDSVLGFAVASALFEKYPNLDEGVLSRVRADVVSRRSCAEVAKRLGLDEVLTEQIVDGAVLARSTNVLAAVLEATLGVLYVAHGIEAVAPAVAEAFWPLAEESLAAGPDAKTQLQEVLARRGLTASYTLLETKGPPHERRFRCAVIVDGEVLGVGEGRSKKDAEQVAANEALTQVGEDGEAATGLS